MKVLTWILVVFSSFAGMGLITETNPDSSTVWGLLYAGMVIAQGVMVLNHLKNEESK